MSGVKYLIEPFACQRMRFFPLVLCVLCVCVCVCPSLVTCQCVRHTSYEEGTLSLTAVTAWHRLSKQILLTH